MIRKYNEKDIEQIEKLGLKLHNKYSFNLDIFSNCLVLLIENKIIGFITYSIMYDRAEIIDIVIDNNFRKQGYGYELLNTVVKECSNNLCKNITLEVNVNNNIAINLYKSVGFKIAALRESYFKNGDNAYLMNLEVI